MNGERSPRSFCAERGLLRTVSNAEFGCSRRKKTRLTPFAWRIAPWQPRSHGAWHVQGWARDRVGAPFNSHFLLLNLPGLADPADPEREVVDLLFFPTGGGKTEAYLGLAAFTMVLRRLRNPGEQGRARGRGQCHHALHSAAIDTRPTWKGRQCGLRA